MTAQRSDAMKALAQCQAIEFGLKQYISHHYKATQVILEKYKLDYDFSANDIKSASLERLLTIFCKLNSNRKIQQELKDFTKLRNHLAHQALLHESLLDAALQTEFEIEERNIGEILATASRIASDLVKELRFLSERLRQPANESAV